MSRFMMLAGLLAGFPALACSVDVEMKVIGFDKAGEHAVVRIERKGDVEGIDVKVVDLRTGKWTSRGGTILDGTEPEASRQKKRAQRWKEVEAALLKDGFTITPALAPLPKQGMELARGVQLVLEGADDEDTGFFGNQLVVKRGERSVTLWKQVGPASDSPSITGVFFSPNRKYLVAVEGGCVNGEVKVFEVEKLAGS